MFTFKSSNISDSFFSIDSATFPSFCSEMTALVEFSIKNFCGCPKPENYGSLQRYQQKHKQSVVCINLLVRVDGVDHYRLPTGTKTRFTVTHGHSVGTHSHSVWKMVLDSSMPYQKKIQKLRQEANRCRMGEAGIWGAAVQCSCFAVFSKCPIFFSL